MEPLKFSPINFQSVANCLSSYSNYIISGDVPICNINLPEPILGMTEMIVYKKELHFAAESRPVKTEFPHLIFIEGHIGRLLKSFPRSANASAAYRFEIDMFSLFGLRKLKQA